MAKKGKKTKKGSGKDDGTTTIASYKRAYRDYEILA
ncbi:MAG: SsrA-binding protein, partial [Ilumatobacter sp.]